METIYFESWYFCVNIYDYLYSYVHLCISKIALVHRRWKFIHLAQCKNLNLNLYILNLSYKTQVNEVIPVITELQIIFIAILFFFICSRFVILILMKFDIRT